MKLLSIITITLILSFNAFAFDNSYITLKLDQIQDIQTFDNEIITNNDLLDGYIKIDNTFINQNTVVRFAA